MNLDDLKRDATTTTTKGDKMPTIKEKPVSDLIRVIELAEVALYYYNKQCSSGMCDDCLCDDGVLARQALSEIRKLKGGQ